MMAEENKDGWKKQRWLEQKKDGWREIRRDYMGIEQQW